MTSRMNGQTDAVRPNERNSEAPGINFQSEHVLPVTLKRFHWALVTLQLITKAILSLNPFLVSPPPLLRRYSRPLVQKSNGYLCSL